MFSRAYLGEFALLIDECDDVHGLDGDHVECLLVVDELYVRPGDGLIVILLLFQLEDVPHEELLKVLVRVVDTQLLKTNKTRRRLKYNYNIISDTTTRVLGRIKKLCAQNWQLQIFGVSYFFSRETAIYSDYNHKYVFT